MRIGGAAFAVSLLAVTAAAALATNIVLAQSGETLIRQKNIAFEPERVAVKVGASVVFVNDDPFGHNVYSESSGGEFDIGRQQTGQRTPVTFRRAGNFEVRCRIHPKMKLEVAVSS